MTLMLASVVIYITFHLGIYIEQVIIYVIKKLLDLFLPLKVVNYKEIFIIKNYLLIYDT